MIAEALMPDERIQSVDNVVVAITGDQILITFTVRTIYGDFEQEVSANV